MAIRHKAALLLAGLTVAAGVSAPIASARATCQSTDFKSMCSTRGSWSMKSRPGTVAPPANMPHMPFTGKDPRETFQQQEAWNDAPEGWTNEAQWARPGASNPFGTFPKPPVFAMD